MAMRQYPYFKDYMKFSVINQKQNFTHIKRCVALAFFMLFFSFALMAQEGQEAWHTVSLNGTWQFKTDLYNRGEEQAWYRQDVDTCNWDQMAVPGNWDLKNEYADYAGKAWYRTTFKASEKWREKAVRLYFESVYNDVKVWLNGKLIGENHMGFLPFWFDIQPSLLYGQSNTLVLQVDNTFKRGAIWNWGGIRRPVWLEITDPVRLEQQHITAVPDLQKGTAQVEVDFEMYNESKAAEKVGYQMTVMHQGKVVWSSPASAKKETVTIEAGKRAQQKLSFQLPKSKVFLWHFNHPALYTCQLQLFQHNQPIHQLSNRFGIRNMEVDGETLKLNGEVIRTAGFNLVPEDRTTGNTLPLWRIKEDVDMMKSLGANMARLSHLPLPREFLDYLDEKGIMVFEEVSLWGKDKMVDPDHPLPKQWLDKMVQVQYNHPAIIGWSVGNEIGYTDRNPKVMEYVKGAIAQAKTLDPHRLAVYVSNSAQNQETDPVQFADLILFNSYGGWGNNVEKVNQLHPGKPIFMSEYGSHLNSEDPNEASIDAAKMLNQFRDKPYMAGVSLWTFNDYRSFWKGSENWTTPPSQNRTWGIVNTFRQKKKPYFAFRREYAPVRSFTVSIPDQKTNRASLVMQPRKQYDIPAYTLRNYTVVWMAQDEQGKLLQGDMIALPVMHPGDQEWQQDFSWNADKLHSLKIALLDPQQYAVLDTTIYFDPPQQPEITKVNTSNDRARVVFKKVPDATAYQLLYGDGQRSAPTINDFIAVSNLKKFTEYSFQVVAINNAGESQPSQAMETSTDEDELPPVIWATLPTDHSFFIGYSVDPLDYLYEIRYGTASGKYDHTVGLRNVGVCQIPGLQSGQTYYYQMRNRKQWGFASEWTQEVAVTLDEGKAEQAVEIKGIIRKGNTALLHFDPVKKAIGYSLYYKKGTAKNWQKIMLDQADVAFARIGSLEKNKDYQFRMEAILDDHAHGDTIIQHTNF